jgi:hypothetical protein
MLFCSCTADTPTPTSSSKEITEVEKKIAMDLVQGAFDDLWAGVDSTKILDYHTEDFIILEQGEVWDNDRIKQYMRGQLAKEDRARRVNLMKYITIEKYGPSMQIAYRNYAKFYKEDSLVNNASWMESALAVETEVGWRLKMMHSTWMGRE